VLAGLLPAACDGGHDPAREAGSATATVSPTQTPEPAPAQDDASPPPVRLTIAVSGDLLPHLPVVDRARALAGGAGYDFAPMFRDLRPLVRVADLALCHVETPLVPGPPAGYPSFRTPPALARAIRVTGWDACSTASNHTVDAGQAGVESTIRALDRARVGHTGSYASRRAQRRPEVVLVNLHWGTEYRQAVDAQQRRLAARLMRSRAVTAIVGQHAHVVQPIRRVRGRWVVFGAGNLLSNQSAACCPAATQDGMVAVLHLRVRGKRARVERIRYTPTFVRQPDYTVLRAGPAGNGESWRRTVAAVGRGRGLQPVPARLPR
jgi:poly-gamma-glutamate capsule biosynthesis protein CapA/YwtB (metallophosphatase superfamily)